jgi:hypothetical protein
MARHQDLRQHAGDDWILPFQVQTTDGVPLALIPGSVVQFKIADPTGAGLTVSSDDVNSVVDVTDWVNGGGRIVINSALQASAGLTARKSYKYELKVEGASFGPAEQLRKKCSIRS